MESKKYGQISWNPLPDKNRRGHLVAMKLHECRNAKSPRALLKHLLTLKISRKPTQTRENALLNLPILSITCTGFPQL